MKFEEALVLMRQGKTIKRDVSPYLHALIDTPAGKAVIMWIVGEQPRMACVSIADMLAVDWGVVE